MFLRRRLERFRWRGMILVIVGLVTVGLTDILYTPNGKNSTEIQPIPEYNATYQPEFNYGNIMLGKEEDGSDDHDPQSLLLGDVLIVCAQVIVASQMVYEEKFITKYNVPALKAVGWEGTFGFMTLATLLIPFYFIPAFFNFAGISVTKEMSATTRMVLDSVRTLVIWGVSLALGWQQFQYLQLIGFASLVTGMCIYNDIVFAPLGRKIVNACSERYNRL